MINKISKTVSSSKKGVLFYATRDFRKRTQIGTKFLIQIASKKFSGNGDNSQEDLDFYPNKYTYESIKAIFEGKDFKKNFNIVFKKDIDTLEKMESELAQFIDLEENNFQNKQPAEIKELLMQDYSLFLTTIKKINKMNKENSSNNSTSENELNQSEKIELNNSLNNSYDPFQNMDKSSTIEKIDFNKLNIFKYFLSYGDFIKSLNSTNSQEKNENILNNKNNDKAINFMNSLCMIFIGNNIHQRILNEISRKTNIFILKGDYFNSLGYSIIASLGNPFLIRLYAKINENFAKSVFFQANLEAIDNKSAFYAKLFDYVIRKNIGFYYLGCLGICELYNKKFFIANKDLVKEFTFKYGILLYLREELAFLKDKSKEYYTKSEELLYSIFLFSEKLMNELCFDNKESFLKNLNKLLSDNNQLDKYKNFAISLCSELVLLIDQMQINNQEDKKDEMKNFFKMIFFDIDEMIRI